MSEDDKTDKEKAVEGLLKDWPSPKPGTGGRTILAGGHPSIPAIRGKGEAHTAVSSAYLVTRTTAPEILDQVEAYMNALYDTKIEHVAPISKGAVEAQHVGIPTTLDSEKQRVYAEIIHDQRINQESRDHDLNVEDQKTSGAKTIEVWKATLIVASAILIAVILTALGIKSGG